MLPFDNKSEFQVVVDHARGHAARGDARPRGEMGARTSRRVPEVTDVQLYAGTAAPFNFNGLVRHYFLRRAPHVADLQVNLVAEARAQARRATPSPSACARRSSRSRRAAARASRWSRCRPGRRCCDTLVAEVYGPTRGRAARRAKTVRGLFETHARRRGRRLTRPRPSATASLVEPRPREGRRSRASPAATAVEALRWPGGPAASWRASTRRATREPVPMRVRLRAADRAEPRRRLALRVDSPVGGQVALGELARVERDAASRSLSSTRTCSRSST